MTHLATQWLDQRAITFTAVTPICTLQVPPLPIPALWCNAVEASVQLRPPGLRGPHAKAGSGAA
jgi:hypothetical protein